MAESEEELKSLLKESEDVGLKLNIQKTKIMGIWSHHFMANRWGNSVRLYFIAAMKLKDDYSLEGKL